MKVALPIVPKVILEMNTTALAGNPPDWTWIANIAADLLFNSTAEVPLSLQYQHSHLRCCLVEPSTALVPSQKERKSNLNFSFQPHRGPLLPGHSAHVSVSCPAGQQHPKPPEPSRTAHTLHCCSPGPEDIGCKARPLFLFSTCTV